MGLMLMTGVSGPLMDTFFLGGNFGRREVVATKATCQVASHFVKLIYFGGIIDQAATLDPVLAAVAVAASMLGTTLARRILEAMSDAQFRTWAEPADHDGRRLLHPLWQLAAARARSAMASFEQKERRDGRDGGPLVLDFVEWIGAGAAALFRGDRDLAHLLPAPDDLGGRGRSRLCRARSRRRDGLSVAITEGGERLLREHGRGCTDAATITFCAHGPHAALTCAARSGSNSCSRIFLAMHEIHHQAGSPP